VRRRIAAEGAARADDEVEALFLVSPTRVDHTHVALVHVLVEEPQQKVAQVARGVAAGQRGYQRHEKKVFPRADDAHEAQHPDAQCVFLREAIAVVGDLFAALMRDFSTF
jgi:hypothetical protein